MKEDRWSSTTQGECAPMISVDKTREQLLASWRDKEYRQAFMEERVRSSLALQVRALRDQRNLTQVAFGKLLNKAQAWVSKLENPEYGKMSVATLLEVAKAFDCDLEIRFRPFSDTLSRLPAQTAEDFHVPSFDEEFEPATPKRSGGGADSPKTKRATKQHKRQPPMGKILAAGDHRDRKRKTTA